VARLLVDGQREKASLYLDRLQALFPERLYIEVIRRQDPIENQSEDSLIELAFGRNLPLVATIGDRDLNLTVGAKPENIKDVFNN